MNARGDMAYLAVDGGGTHCRFVLAIHGARVLAHGGTANVSTDFNAARQVLVAGLEDLSVQAEVPLETVFSLPAFVGVAGVTGPEMASRLSDALPLTRAKCADDRPAALRGALGDGDGFIAHCGTGSFFASQINGQPRLAGGWGSVLGDEASAMWVGRNLLSVTLRCVDGFLEHSRLTRWVLSELGGSAGIVRFAANAGPAEFGSLAPRVTDALAQNDTIATKLMQDAAASAASQLMSLGWSSGLPICLTGGIAEQYHAFLPSEMQAAVHAPLGTPLDGAEALARDHAMEGLA
ncbi:MAG: BadF/BadG/BcrA/BcrD ATPase family protein [Pseudomonadota bacterium]